MPAQPIVFDVNETVLDIAALDPLFVDAFGDTSVRRLWFAQTLQNALAATLYGHYQPFDEMARAALEMTARSRGLRLDDARAQRILGGMITLPAHGDVREGLTILRDAGFRMAVFSQSPEATLEAQFKSAGLRDFFDHVISVDEAEHCKPSPKAYAIATHRLDHVRPLLVASHGWDIAGAMAAGWDAAFVARHGATLNPLEPPPVIAENDLRAVARAIVARDATLP